MNRKHRSHFKGQDLIEYALLVPFMMLFIMTIFDLGRATVYYASLNNATREAARFATIQTNPCDANFGTNVAAIVAERTIGMAADDLDIFVNPQGIFQSGSSCRATSAGSAIIEVSATYCFVPITPLSMNTLNGVIRLLNDDYIPGNCIDLNSTSTMHLEL